MRPKANQRTAAEALVDQLIVNGVEHVFCVPGESYLAVLDAFHDRPINVTVCRQEGGAAMMAEAVGKATGHPGVCFVTRGPGATNASPGIHIAQQDSSPMLLFVGQVGRDMREREAFQEVDFRAMFGRMAKWATEIDDPARVPEFVSRAFYVATSGRPGPVVIALPEDMLTEQIATPPAPAFEPVETSPGAAEMTKLHALLCAAQHPIMLLGGSRWSTAARDAIARFAESFALPVATTFRRAHLFDALSPNYAGDLGIAPNPKLLARVKAADLVLMVGGRLGELPSQGYTLIDIPSPQMNFVHVHPAAEELGRVYRPHLAIHASPTAFAAAAAELAPPRVIPWREETETARAEYLAWSGEPTEVPGAVNLGAIMVWLRETLPARCDRVQRRRQLRGLDPSLLPVPPLCDADRAHLGLHGLWRARSDRHEAGLSRADRRGVRRRRRLPNERSGIRDGRAVRPARRHHRLRQLNLRHHPHASGARISRTDFRNDPAQPGFCRLCPRLRRLWRHRRANRGFRRRLSRSASFGQACDHSSSD